MILGTGREVMRSPSPSRYEQASHSDSFVRVTLCVFTLVLPCNPKIDENNACVPENFQLQWAAQNVIMTLNQSLM